MVTIKKKSDLDEQDVANAIRQLVAEEGAAVLIGSYYGPAYRIALGKLSDGTGYWLDREAPDCWHESEVASVALPDPGPVEDPADDPSNPDRQAFVRDILIEHGVDPETLDDDEERDAEAVALIEIDGGLIEELAMALIEAAYADANE